MFFIAGKSVRFIRRNFFNLGSTSNSFVITRNVTHVNHTFVIQRAVKISGSQKFLIILFWDVLYVACVITRATDSDGNEGNAPWYAYCNAQNSSVHRLYQKKPVSIHLPTSRTKLINRRSHSQQTSVIPSSKHQGEVDQTHLRRICLTRFIPYKSTCVGNRLSRQMNPSATTRFCSASQCRILRWTIYKLWRSTRNDPSFDPNSDVIGRSRCPLMCICLTFFSNANTFAALMGTVIVVHLFDVLP